MAGVFLWGKDGNRFIRSGKEQRSVYEYGRILECLPLLIGLYVIWAMGLVTGGLEAGDSTHDPRGNRPRKLRSCTVGDITFRCFLQGGTYVEGISMELYYITQECKVLLRLLSQADVLLFVAMLCIHIADRCIAIAIILVTEFSYDVIIVFMSFQQTSYNSMFI